MTGKIGLQARVGQWVLSTFGAFIATSRRERALRVVEEAIELAQAEGLHPVYIKAVAERVYSRPKGTARAEGGGVGVTYLAWCEAFGEDHKKLIEKELARISTPEMIGRCREKQKEKVLVGVGFEGK